MPRLLSQDAENSYLAEGLTEAGAVEELTGSSITYRIAVGPHKGRPVYRLQSLPAAQPEEVRTEAGKAGGFSLHAGISTKKGQRKKPERLCRYVSRPAVSEKRLSLTQNGQVCYELKTPYRDGTTHVIFDPLDFIARLVALIPKPRVNLARYHGVFIPGVLPSTPSGPACGCSKSFLTILCPEHPLARSSNAREQRQRV